MKNPIIVVLDTTIEPTVNGWHIGPFSTLGGAWKAGSDSIARWRLHTRMVVILVLILVALLASALAEAFPLRASDLFHVRRFAPNTVLPLNESEWRDATPGMPPGSRYALITGDPAKAEPFVMRVELPQGYRVAPYSRSTDENLIVLSGTLMIGHGRSFDPIRMRALPSGSFQRLRANEARYMITIDGATVQIFGVGPLALDYVTSQ